MATRRPRFKPAAILTARRTTTHENATIKTEKPEAAASIKLEENIAEVTGRILEVPVVKIEQITTNTPTEDVATKKNDTELGKGRRIIKPAVCLPVRKRKTVPASTVTDKESVPIKLDGNIKAEQSEQTERTLISPTPDQNANIENVPKESSDNYFKSPFMSPSIQSSQQQKRFEFIHNPLNADDHRKGDSIEDNIKYPLSPAKVRQRIRPTPCFGNRRNSLQSGNVSESDDESNRRQRHVSTSSNHSNYNNYSGSNSNAAVRSGGSINGNRLRTESVCSNISDVLSVRETSHKPKRTVRSDEYQRIVNAKREFSLRFNGGTPDKARLTMFDMIYYNPITNPMKSPAIKQIDIKDRRLSSISHASAANSNKERRMSTASNVSVASRGTSIAESIASAASVIKKEKEAETMMPVPQLKLGPNGEIILDEKSLVIETTGDKEARETLANADIVYDDEFSGTSGFYKRNKRTKDWPSEETIKFYRCLHTIGTDFSLMLTLFPNRSRRDLKLKFKKEEKYNAGLINKALLYPKQFNIDELQKDFEREEAEAVERNKKWEEAKQKRQKEKKNFLSSIERTHSISKAMRTISDGENIFEYEYVKAPKRQPLRRKAKNARDTGITYMEGESEPLASTVADSNVIENRISSTTYTDVNDSCASNTETGQSLPSFNEVLLSANQTVPLPIQKVEKPEMTINPPAEVIQHPNLVVTAEDLYDVTSIIPRGDELFMETCIDRHTSQPSDGDGGYKLNSQDILNMEIIFDNVDNANITVTPAGSSLNQPMDNQNAGNTVVTSIVNNQNYSDVVATAMQTSLINEIVSTDMDIDESCISETATGYNDGLYDDVHDKKMYVDVLHCKYEETCGDDQYLQNETGGHSYIITTADADHQETYETIGDVPQETAMQEDIQIYSYEDNERDVAANEEIVYFDEDDGTHEEQQDNMNLCDNEDYGNDEEYADEEYDENVYGGEEGNADGGDDDDGLSSLADSLVVVARRDPNDADKVIHEVFLMSPETGILSEEPLDLPQDVIDRIKSSLTVQQA